MNLLNKTLLIGGIFFALTGIGEVTAVLIALGWAVLTVVKSFSKEFNFIRYQYFVAPIAAGYLFRLLF